MPTKIEVAKSSLNLQLILDATPDLYLILDPDYSVVAASRAYLHATNTALPDIVGRNLFEAFPDDPRNASSAGVNNLKASLDRVMKSHKADAMPVQRYDLRRSNRSDGSFEEGYWNFANYPVVNENGTVVYIKHKAENVTPFIHLLPKNESGEAFFLNTEFLSRMVDALSASDARHAGMIASAMDGIISIDSGERITVFNATAERMFGYAAREVIGKKVEMLMPARFRAAHSSHIKTYGETNVTHRMMGRLGEITGLRANGEEFPIEASISQMGDGASKLYTVIMRDISEKKKIEAQFLRAQRMESIGTLAGGIAHDLNNILAPITLSIGLLKSLVQQPLALEVLETIDISAKRGADIVQQVLSFARGLEGRVIEVSPKHLMKDVEAIIKDTLPKDVSLNMTVEPDIWTLEGDPTQLHQLILNLCVNARDAMPSGGQLSVSARNIVLDEHYVAMDKKAKAGKYVLLSVTDTGIGIPPDIIDKIFEPFFTTKALGKGTGLGLSSVLGIAKSHGGFVSVYSEPRKGSTFKAYIPAISASAAGTATPEGEAVILPRGNGETILVVDDEASILAITSQTLQAFGYKVITAKNGAEAVAAYAQRRDIAAVLTDMMMPIMDGPATIHALLQINPAIRIIAASGLDANGAVAKATNDGIRFFLKKPYTAAALLQTLDAILKSERK